MRRFFVSLRKSLRTNFHLVASYLRTNWRLFLLSLVIGLIVIYAFPQIISSLSFKKDNSIGVVGNYTLSTLPLSFQKEISFGLTTLDLSDQATSGAALSWTQSSDGKSITFNLDRNLFWQDGTKFDTSQINYNLKGVEVKRLSLYSLQFNFKEPFSPLPVIVSQPLFKPGLVGLGKNKVQSVKFNGRFIESLRLQNLDTGGFKTYKFFPTEKIAVTALKLGSINQLLNVHSTFDLQKDPHYQINSKVESNTEATIFLNQRKDKLADKTFRQSLNYSLPDTFLQGDAALSSLPQNSWAQTDSAKRYNQNLDLAKSDLAKMGSTSAKPKMILYSVVQLEDVAKIVADSWNSVGIPTSVRLTDNPPDDFDAYLTYLSLPADPDQYALWHSTQIGNIATYKSFKSDRLLEDGRKTFDPQQRKQIYADFEKALTEDIPAIFLFYPRVYDIKRQ